MEWFHFSTFECPWVYLSMKTSWHHYCSRIDLWEFSTLQKDSHFHASLKPRDLGHPPKYPPGLCCVFLPLRKCLCIWCCWFRNINFCVFPYSILIQYNFHIVFRSTKIQHALQCILQPQFVERHFSCTWDNLHQKKICKSKFLSKKICNKVSM